MIFITLFAENYLQYKIRHMIFQYGAEPIQPQWILIGFEDIMEIILFFRLQKYSKLNIWFSKGTKTQSHK